MSKMTPKDKARWEKAKKHGYASYRNGERFVLKYDDERGTVLVPLESLRVPSKQESAA